MELSITTLSENTSSPRRRLLAEWGLSILIDVDGFKILLDTGQSISAVHNAGMMGIDLSQVDKMVLSHGHYDHTGGLQQVLARIGKEIDIFAHPDIWALKYVYFPRQDNYVYDGIPFRREEMESLGASFILTTEPVWITDRVVTSGEIPMITEYEEVEPRLRVKEDDEFRPDPVDDDQAVFIKTDQGLWVMLGCGHRGIINTLRHAQHLTGIEHVHTVIGGAHLLNVNEVQMELTIAELREFGIQRMGLCHCTGFWPQARLAEEFGEIFFLNNAGTQITF